VFLSMHYRNSFIHLLMFIGKSFAAAKAAALPGYRYWAVVLIPIFFMAFCNEEIGWFLSKKLDINEGAFESLILIEARLTAFTGERADKFIGETGTVETVYMFLFI